EIARQRDARKERGARRADVGIRRDQLLLGGEDVWPPLQQFGRQAGRQVRRQLLGGERHRLRQVRRQRLTDQEHQGVHVLCTLSERLRERGTGTFEQGLGLAEVE